MARTARVVAAGVPHHVTQRGNNRQDVFLTDEDRRAYLDGLRKRAEEENLRILGYCLMANHVHLVGVPERDDSLARALGRTHSSYARCFNRKYLRSGHLWQNRFYSCPLGASHLYRALGYVDLNPVRAGLVGSARQYPWSSARAHCGANDPAGLIDEWSWSELEYSADWAELLSRGVDGAVELRAATYAGHAWGEESFVRTLEKQAQRPLRRLRPGPKSTAKAAAA
jgi:putative transposase